MHPAALPIEELRHDCQIERTRRGGPGGQHRNKVESAVVITHLPSGLHGEASERRSQHENLPIAWQRLRVQLALGIRQEVAIDAEPSSLWRGRIRGGKISVNPDHADFPTLLAEALDCLSVAAWDHAVAAHRLAISNSQFIKFLQLEPLALHQLNTHRAARGQHCLS